MDVHLGCCWVGQLAADVYSDDDDDDGNGDGDDVDNSIGGGMFALFHRPLIITLCPVRYNSPSPFPPSNEAPN